MQVPGSDFSLHRFPKDLALRKKWFNGLCLQEGDVNAESRVCSFHFRDGDVKNIPSLSIGPHSGTGPQKLSVRTECCAARPIVCARGTSKRPKQAFRAPTSTLTSFTSSRQPLIASPTESLIGSSDADAGSDVSVMLSEFSESGSYETHSFDNEPGPSHNSAQIEVVIHAALAAQVEALTADNTELKRKVQSGQRAPFGIELIMHNDTLVSHYTGFPSYDIFLAFFTFLGPAVNY